MQKKPMKNKTQNQYRIKFFPYFKFPYLIIGGNITLLELMGSILFFLANNIEFGVDELNFEQEAVENNESSGLLGGKNFYLDLKFGKIN